MKDTLNLPHTDFPMKANLAQNEVQRLKKWQEEDLYGQIRAARRGKPKYILNDGPPYANGNIHLGHALNKILKDIIIKYYTLSGYDAPFVPGWDCHGLPIELNVEKKVGKPGDKISPAEFRTACRTYAEQQIATQKEDFKRLGVLADWENPYKTMDFEFEADIMASLFKIQERGYLSKGFKPVHWCLECASALAEAEVEYQEKTSNSIDVAFLAADPKKIWALFGRKGVEPIAWVIWTTTPWTLPANRAVALGPDLEYVAVKLRHKPYAIIVAKALVNHLLERYEEAEAEIVGQPCLGRDFVREDEPTATAEGEGTRGGSTHSIACHPFEDRPVAVVCGDHVTVEAGTGCVHTAPNHGVEDFELSRRYSIGLCHVVGPNGCYLPETPHFAGQHIRKVEAAIIALLAEKGVLLAATSIKHSYPHCWRHKTPLIFRATAQWFISMDQKVRIQGCDTTLRAQALEAIQAVTWIPDWGQARISDMIASRPDWCISRQRTWGVPLPLFVHRVSGDVYPKMQDLVPTILAAVRDKGIEGWHTLSDEALLGADTAEYERLKHTLDVWFDSGVVHAAVLDKRPGLQSPADLYLEGSDQHRGWFHSSLLTSVAMKGTAPYKKVLTHGYTVDAQGRKMSKSLGNVVEPAQVIQKMGADVLRLWVAATDYRIEINACDEILARISDAYRRIRNTARFMLSNLQGFDPDQHVVPVSEMVALDAWIVDQALSYQNDILAAYQADHFHVIYQKIQNFCVVELGGFYLDVIKDRQYTAKANGHARRSAQSALYHVLQAFVRWIAPILSFTAEEIWQYLPQKEGSSVFLSTWYTGLEPLPKSSPLQQSDWTLILQVRQAVNKALEEARAQKLLGSGLEAELVLYGAGSTYQALATLQDELRFVLITSQAQLVYAEQIPAGMAVLEGIEGFGLDLKASSAPKCGRCWHRRADVGENPVYPDACMRCVANMETEEGEKRHYA